MLVVDIKLGKKHGNEKQNYRYAYCICDCGNISMVRLDRLKSGITTSCGCNKIIKCKTNLKHGLSGTKLHKCWLHMRDRCYNPNDKRYKNYGARGISICKEWKDDYLTFREWAINSGYQEGLSIERISVNGNYCQDNCTWIPFNLQNSNRTNTKYIEAFGETKGCSEWSRDIRCQVQYHTLKHRIDLGWEAEKAIITKSSHKNK